MARGGPTRRRRPAAPCGQDLAKFVAPVEGRNRAAATSYSGDVTHVVRSVFAGEDGAWRLDDIAGGERDDKRDLREIIKPGAK